MQALTPGGVGAQGVAHVAVGGVPLSLRGAMQSDAALETIDVQRVLAKHFGESTAGQPARQLHLPQTILGVAEPWPKKASRGSRALMCGMPQRSRTISTGAVSPLSRTSPSSAGSGRRNRYPNAPAASAPVAPRRRRRG